MEGKSEIPSEHYLKAPEMLRAVQEKSLSGAQFSWAGILRNC